MAVTRLTVDAESLALSGSARLDPRHHYLRRVADPVIAELGRARKLEEFVDFSNGVNLPRVAYADEIGEAGALYASVAAVATFAFRNEACVPLLPTATDEGKIVRAAARTEDIAVGAHEVLVTRSRASAPGLAWPGSAAAADLPIIPSGFMIRLSITDDTPASYVAAVLNHPAWRLLTAALAAGKSQDNLSQESLRLVPIPVLDPATARALAASYEAVLQQINALYDSESEFSALCDRVISEVLGIGPPTIPNARLTRFRVGLDAVARARGVRIDLRWHGPANTAVRELLASIPTQPLGTLLVGPPTKGRQPTWASEDDILGGESPLAVATATIQSGMVAWDRAKPTVDSSVVRFPVMDGQLLVAMDGDGSLGKATVFRSERLGTVDSHVARCVVGIGEGGADALSCWLNSTWGRVQTNSLMTGSTGQTQLSPTDLAAVLVPTGLAEQADLVAKKYLESLDEFEPITRRARRLMCEMAAELSQALLREGVLERSDDLEPFLNVDGLMAGFDRLYPSKRV